MNSPVTDDIPFEGAQRGRLRGRMARLLLALACGALFLFYLRWLSRFFDWDSVVYALSVEEGDPYYLFLNPHHLGFESTGRLYLELVRMWIPRVDVMFALRLRILASAVLFLFAFTLIHYSTYRRATTTFLTALCIAFSQGFWYYSNHNDTPLLPACFIALTFLMAARQARLGVTLPGLILMGVLQLFSVFYHQTNALFLPMTAAAILMAPTYRGREFAVSRRMRVALIYVLIIAAILAAAYLYVAFFILNRSLVGGGKAQFSTWLIWYATLERWGFSPLKKSYVLDFYRGIGDAFLNFKGTDAPMRVNFSDDLDGPSLPYNINAAFWGVIILLALVNIRGLMKKYGREMAPLVLWIIPSIAFYGWWQGYFFEFWVGTSIALWIFSFYVLTALPTGSLAHTGAAAVNLVYVSMALLLLTVNLAFSALPRSRAVLFDLVVSDPRLGPEARRLAREGVYKRPYYYYAPAAKKKKKRAKGKKKAATSKVKSNKGK